MTDQSPIKPASSAGDRQSYKSGLIDMLRGRGYRLEHGRLTFVCARKFGFCWGVDKAVEIVQDAMEAHPGKQIWMVNQMIHNPAVNQDLIRQGVKFIKGVYSEGEGFDAVKEDDVAIIPAFSSEVEEIHKLKEIGCAIIDTTCPWVLKPHLRTKRNIEAGFTTVIHATMGHDETRSTCSLINHHGGKFVVVRNIEQTRLLCRFITGKTSGAELMEVLGECSSQGLDPERDLDRIALINQTTMLASESRTIGRMIESAVIERFGEDDLKQVFRDFDTICNATQDNQDAMVDMVQSDDLDLLIVVGGFESSNTKNLARIAQDVVPTYHIEDADCLEPDQIRHLPVDSYTPHVSTHWIPSRDALVVGFSAGASTPDTKLEEVMNKVAELCGEPLINPALH